MDASEPTPHSDDAVERQAGGWQKVREWIQIIVIALLISLPIRFFVAEPFIVNGASMDPTFSTGQFLIVDRLTYRFESPARGDVIIFQYPLSPPGDQIYY
ncbi:MAG: signal peptidase I, partial [Patescibacteria group bacterium]|nr:signal peptidase I [Patescibacteria group bacterium]